VRDEMVSDSVRLRAEWVFRVAPDNGKIAAWRIEGLGWSALIVGDPERDHAQLLREIAGLMASEGGLAKLRQGGRE
jgi:hypothetical protein